jgi:hypothetical protein
MKTLSLSLLFVAAITGCAVDASTPLPSDLTPAGAAADDVAEPDKSDAPSQPTKKHEQSSSSPTSLDVPCAACGPGPQPWNGGESEPSRR